MNLTRVAVFISKYLKFGELYCPRRKNYPNFRYFEGKTETLIIINLRHVDMRHNNMKFIVRIHYLF